LYEYLKNRMVAIAPNLTVMVGELVGARLISHAGSLLNLAKHPASTVQILGSEKALFKALKTNHDTPKYGLIYHAQVVGSATTKLKGKASRMLAAKAALSTRVDALGEDVSAELGVEHRAKVEARIRSLEGGHAYKVSGTSKQTAKHDKYEHKSEIVQYKDAADSSLASSNKKKRKFTEEENGENGENGENKEEQEKTPEKSKKNKKRKEADEQMSSNKKKRKSTEGENDENGENKEEQEKTPKKSKKNKKRKVADEDQ